MRDTPVKAARTLGIRPQLVYGFIKHNKLRTFPNPDGKAHLIDLAELKQVVAGMGHHQPRSESGKREVPRGIARGTVLSYHGRMPKERKSSPHRVVAVTQVVEDDNGQPVLVFTKRGDGTTGITYEIGELNTALAKGKCTIESPEKLLGAVLFSWVHTGKVELAAELQRWCEANDVNFGTVEEAAG